MLMPGPELAAQRSRVETSQAQFEKVRDARPNGSASGWNSSRVAIVEIERGEAVKFWTRIIGEHADFFAHLLDPQEATLIKKAMETSNAFDELHDSPPSSMEPAEKAVQEVIDFKTAAVEGIETGEIKSIIHPLLADHVRREAVKCADELKRAA